MPWIDKLKNNIFYLLAGGVYTFALASACLSTTYIQLTQGRVFALAFVAMAIFCLWFYNRYAFWGGLCLLLGGGLITWLILYLKDYEVLWFKNLIFFGESLLRHIQGLTPYSERFAVLGTCIIFGFALVTAAAIRSGAGFYCLTLMGFGIFGVLSYLEYPIANLHMLCVLFVFVTLFARRLSREAVRSGGDLAINFSGLALLPICLLLVWTAGKLPQPEAASTKSVRDNVVVNLSAVDEFFYGKLSPKYFNFSTTGFSGLNGRLGGNVRPNERYVMEVYNPSGYWPYLAGAYKDTYEGDRWRWSFPAADLPVFEFEGNRYLSGWAYIGQNVVVLGNPTPEDLLPYERIQGLQQSPYTILIFPGRMTRAMFSPNVTLMAQTWPSGLEIETPGDPAHAIPPSWRPVSEAETFSPANLTRTDTGALESKELLSGQSAYQAIFFPANVGQGYANNGHVNVEGFEVPEEAMAPYLALPETLPQRVRDLAQAIVDEAGAQNDYTKMKALETYLHRFPYTLEPGPIPADVDFVDYFLFEGQQGYCTYYATALAVMGRCIGIPTRYAEGYTLPTEQNDNGGLDVTNANAHAWCEAIIPGYGWIGFEATAPYSYAFYHGGQQAPSHDVFDPEQYPGRGDEFIDDPLMADVRERENRQPVETTEPTPEDEAPQGSRAGWFVLTLLLMILATGGVVALRFHLYQQRMEKLDALPNREAALDYYRRIVALLRARGAPMQEGETAAAYGARLDGAQTGGPHHKLALIFCQAAYSRHDITDSDRAALLEGYEKLLTRKDAPLQEQGKAFLERYVLGKY